MDGTSMYVVFYVRGDGRKVESGPYYSVSIEPYRITVMNDDVDTVRRCIGLRNQNDKWTVYDGNSLVTTDEVCIITK